MLILARKVRDTRSGFTIIEVIIASVIFGLVAIGSYSSMAALKKPTMESSEEVTAAYIGRQVLEDLRSQVDAATWDTGALSPTGGPGGDGSYVTGTNDFVKEVKVGQGTSREVTYRPSYQVTQDTLTNARQVTVTVTW